MYLVMKNLFTFRASRALLCAAGMLSLGVAPAVAETSDGLYSGNDVTEFNDFLTDRTSDFMLHYLSMESLWEYDMSKASNGAAAGDAYENNHNLFVIGDIVYVYVEPYVGSGAPQFCVRRFNVADGQELEPLTGSFPSEAGSMERYMAADDNGNIALICFTASSSSNSNTPFRYKIVVYEPDMKNPVKDYSGSFETSVPYDHYMLKINWEGIEGDLVSGNFTINLSSWYEHAPYSSQRFDMYPSRCKVIFSEHSDLPVTEYYRIGGIQTKDNCSSAFWQNLLYTEPIGDNRYLVQQFGSSAGTTTPSNLMLYSAPESVTEGEIVTLQKQETLTSSTFYTGDPYCFGALPIDIADKHVLILPYSFNADGPKFKVAYWKDQSTFDNLQEVWTYPSKKFPYPAQIYEMTRPQFATVPVYATEDDTETENYMPASRIGEKTPSEMHIFTYMPGSFLSHNKLIVKKIADISGITAATYPRAEWEINGNSIRITTESTVDLTLMTVNGMTLQRTVVNAPGTTIHSLPNGLYIMMLDTVPVKLLIR